MKIRVKDDDGDTHFVEVETTEEHSGDTFGRVTIGGDEKWVAL